MDLEFIIRVTLNFKLTYVDCDWGNFRMLPNTKTFSDQAANNLEFRKKELLTQYLKQESYFVQLQVFLYRLQKKYYPRIKYIICVLRDKINFEVSKFKTNKR